MVYSYAIFLWKRQFSIEIWLFCDFREIRQKAGVVFHPENYTVSYLYQRWWFFEPELTNGSLNDSITQLNAVAIVSNLYLYLRTWERIISFVSHVKSFNEWKLSLDWFTKLREMWIVSVSKTQSALLGRRAAKYFIVHVDGIESAHHQDCERTLVRRLRRLSH